MLQWGTIQTRGGEDAIYNLPYAFPTGGLWAMGCRGTTGYSQAMNVRLANRSQISIQNWAPAGSLEDCCFCCGVFMNKFYQGVFIRKHLKKHIFLPERGRRMPPV